MSWLRLRERGGDADTFLDLLNSLVVGPESSSFIKTVAKLGECPTEASSGSNVAALPVVVLKGCVKSLFVRVTAQLFANF